MTGWGRIPRVQIEKQSLGIPLDRTHLLASDSVADFLAGGENNE